MGLSIGAMQGTCSVEGRGEPTNGNHTAAAIPLTHVEIERVCTLRERLLSESEDDFGGGTLSPNAPLPFSARAIDNVEHTVRDVYTITLLALKLGQYLWRGVRWWGQFVRLLAYTVLLLPGFAQMVAFYFFSPRLLRSVPYGPNPRNRLDVYLPRRRWRREGPCPVLIYVTGGAWMIGYKAWGALFGRRLSQRGVLVFCLDYRNYPQGTALDMLEDINTGIRFVLENAHLYGGNLDDCTLIGQSAGGHLCALALLAQVMQATGGGAPLLGGAPSWQPSRFKAFVGVSGAYNMVTLADHLHRKGFYRSIFHAIMAGPDGGLLLEELSPTLAAHGLTPVAAALMPPVLLLHGTADKSVPVAHAQEFADALQGAGARCFLTAYKGKTHTQPIVEDPMRGGRDELMDDVLTVVKGQRCVNHQFPMLPSALIDAATWVVPF